MPGSPSYILHDPVSRQTPFPDVLRVYNGFEPGRSWIDLRPRMELHIEDAYYRPGAPRSGLAGFLGTEIAQYELRPHGGLQLLSVQSMKERPEGQAPVENLISPAQRDHRYFRFYYEVFFKANKSSRGSVLIGANTESQISGLSDQLMRNPDSVCNQNSERCTVFPEACSVSVEMQIVVNRSPRNVLWGSVLSDVVDHPQQLELLRIYRGHLIPVKLEVSDAKALRLPLLPGDRVISK